MKGKRLSKILRGLGNLIILIGLLVGLWFLIKPLRVARADQYISEATPLSYLKASVLTPFSPLIHLKLGLAYQEYGQIKKAKQEFKKVLAICEKFGWKIKNCQINNEYREAFLGLKKIEIERAIKKGETEEAERLLASALELNSFDPEIEFYWAVILSSQGEYKTALESPGSEIPNPQHEKRRQILLSCLKKISSRYSGAYPPFLIGLGFYKMGYDNLAIKQFEKALEVEPNYRDALIALGRVYLSLNQPEKAVEYLERAAEIDPVYPEAFYLLSEAYRELKKLGEAEKAHKKAEALGWK